MRERELTPDLRGDACEQLNDGGGVPSARGRWGAKYVCGMETGTDRPAGAAPAGAPAVLILVTSHLTGRGGRESVIRQVLAELGRVPGRAGLAMLDHVDDRNWEHSLPGPVYVAGIEANGALRTHLPAVLRFVRRVIAEFRPDAVLVTEPLAAPLVRMAAWFHRGAGPAVLSWLHVDPRKVRFGWALRCVDGHLGISAGVLHHLPPPVGGKPAYVVYNPVELDGVGVLPRGRKGAAVPLLFVGRLEEHKGVDRILEALGRIAARNWVLHVLGDGTESGALRRQADMLGIDSRIIWHGWAADPWGVVPEASLLLLASRTEGFPVVLLEAMARGIPVLAMDCPFGPSEIVVPGRNGWLVPAGDVQGMAEKVDAICSGRCALPTHNDVRITADRFAPDVVARRISMAVQDAQRRRQSRSAARAGG